MTRVLVVRHAVAVERDDWDGDDRLRPLDEKGRRQADALAGTLAELGADGLYSSPAIRCIATFEPAAALLGLSIETRSELFEGAKSDDVLSLLDELTVSTPALSTHGDVVDALVPGEPCKKGAIWVVEVEDGGVRPERYLPPPD